MILYLQMCHNHQTQSKRPPFYISGRGTLKTTSEE